MGNSIINVVDVNNPGNTRKSVDLLPNVFRTNKNTKFLSGTLDPLIQSPNIDKISGWVGSTSTVTYNSATDFYITADLPLRQAYQLEPAVIVSDKQQNITNAFSYDDLINQLSFDGAPVNNLDRLLRPQFESYNPHIDWDKFVNFTQYYWVPTGPDPIDIVGAQKATVSTYKVTDDDTKENFILTPDGLTPDETIVLYRGTTYNFDVNSSHRFYIKTKRTQNESDIFNINVINNGTSLGTVTFYVDQFAPDTLYYATDDSPYPGGVILILDPIQDTVINVENEVVGKENYKSGNGISLSNGMKIQFLGEVIPSNYANKQFLVEGVGTSIQLIDYSTLSTPEAYSDMLDDNFDGTSFDEYPFDTFENLPLTPEYVTINRASADRNPWTRYNRWFHQDVLIATAAATGQPLNLPINGRATRPIIEFDPNLQLFNFGSQSQTNIDFIDTVTTDAFKQAEGQTGYYVDGILLQQGNLVVFAVDTDPDVINQVYQVQFVNNDGMMRINFVPVFTMNDYDSVIVNQGNTQQGKSWYFTNTNGVGTWHFAQQKSELNQAPLFDIFDNNGNSFSNSTYYNSDFSGCRMFGYAVGTGSNDPVLGFPLEYKNIADQAYYLFNNYFMTDTFHNVVNQVNNTLNVNTGFLKFNGSNVEYVTVWESSESYNIPLTNGNYDISIGYTNNPLNGDIAQFTLSELSAHAQTMADRDPNFTGSLYGSNNIRDLSNFASYGTRLIQNNNPLTFASYFVCDLTHDVELAIRTVGQQYNLYKLKLLVAATKLAQQHTPAAALDICLHNVNLINTGSFPYSNSDMLGWGPHNTTRTYTVTDYRFTSYTLPNGQFSIDELGTRAVYVYHTDTSGNITQLVLGSDYEFDPVLADVNISYPLTKGDTITVVDYPTTQGCFIPMTPTKMGLYPAFEPEMYIDESYITPVPVIKGHDGSITVAYGDIRDDVLLEFERRIYNNLKVKYNTELLDINSVIPGASRSTDYTFSEVTTVLEKEFLQWTNLYGFDYSTNDTYNTDSLFSFNYSAAVDPLTGNAVPGYWRGIYKYYYDTDQPHLAPWEMLGFANMPSWWEDTYGPAPYTNGNMILWNDLASGNIAGGDTPGINPLYVRPNLLNFIPVDSSGNLLDPIAAGMASRLNPLTTTNPWKFGDQGPTETAWRRSSQFPFAIQIMLASLKPADFYSKLFDTSRMVKNMAGHYVYSETMSFLTPAEVVIYNDTSSGTPVLATGYHPMVVEIGQQQSTDFISNLKSDLGSLNLQLLYKVGGFTEKDSLEITIDSVNPSTANPGVALSNEDYSIFLNQGNPFLVASISGLIIQKTESGYMLKGYDKSHPYFTIYNPIYTASSPTLTVGGKSAPYLTWTPSSTDINRDTTSPAASASSDKFYQAGQYIFYNNLWYIVTISHTAGTTFNPSYFQQIPKLPTTGGISVIMPTRYESTTTIIPYGTTFTSEQELYNVIMGYGQWLVDQGFVFDDYQGDMQQVLDWTYAAKEFLYWAIQGWASDSLITISPFSNQLKFNNSFGVVDNVLNGFYQYSLLRADGQVLTNSKVSTQRIDNTFMINTLDANEGLFFAELNVVQKEHNIILNNTSYFNDIIYDIETGYRQGRIKLVGFVTAGWTGGMQSPGFIYDEAKFSTWSEYTDYTAGDIVQYNGAYYGASTNLDGTSTFVFSSWNLLPNTPTPGLLPNFDLKAKQFQEFYTLNIDGFDPDQQSLAQHLIGFQPRTYLQNIFSDQVTQYKFYQGFIKEKGTRNSINRLDKASVISLDTSIDYYEEWAFRTGAYGSFSTFEELEFTLNEQEFVENPQIINFVNQLPVNPNDFISYKSPNNLEKSPTDYNSVPFATQYFSDLDITKTLPVAGYVRLDDVTATAYNKNSIVSIANNGALVVGNTIWLGFREDQSWDVYRYTLLGATVINAVLSIPGSQLTITTNEAHGLIAGDLISITQFGTDINGVYTVQSVTGYNTFTLATTLTFLTVPFVPSTGLIYKFASVRHALLSDVPNNPIIDQLNYGENIWVDNADGEGHWAVYQKSNVYVSNTFQNIEPGINLTYNQQFGDKVITDGTYVFVASPNYTTIVSGGRVLVYKKIGTGATQLLKLYSIDYTDTPNINNGFGTAMGYDSEEEILAIGAPNANTGAGTVKFVQFDTAKNALSLYSAVSSPNPTVNGNFGTDIYVTTTGTIYVGEPGTARVWYSTNFRDALGTPTFTNTNFTSTIGSLFGQSICGSSDGKVAVGAPGADKVYVYLGSTVQTINSPIVSGQNFGYKVVMDSSGQTLYVSAPQAKQVFVYGFANGSFVLGQTLTTPNPSEDTLYGIDISIDQAADTLVISSSGMGIDTTTFDTYSEPLANSTSTYGTPYVKDPSSSNNSSITTFDGKATSFYGTFNSSGNVYVYNRFGFGFVLGQTLVDPTVQPTDGYGTSVASSDGFVLVGAPSTDLATTQTSNLFVFNSTASTSWSVLRQEVPVVDLSTISRTYTIDTTKDQIQNYIEILDPIKGRIPGLAEQELTYKAIFDPAVYSVGNTTTVNDTKSNWLDEHLGELWWDLSTIKYVWAEQGDLEFRRNSWNTTFPGSTVDIYEWVKSTYLPSQWAAIADTVAGLAQGISGQPKYPDNSVVSVKQVFNSLTNAFVNVYYFWVKNKNTVPSLPNRSMSGYDVANLIADPKAQGVMFSSIIDPSALMLTNVKPILNDNNINLVIETDNIDTDINRHTEWMLLRENDPNSVPMIGSPLLQKLLDSIVGRDSLGNPVPDPTLSDREKYGIEFRPRQSMFVDRISALRSLLQYINSVFLNYQVNEENYNFTTLYSSEQPDDPSVGSYDLVVEDNVAFDAISTRYWKQAKLNVTVINGRINSVTIADPGYGYGNFTGLSQDDYGNYITWKGPVVNILGDGQGADIRTIVNASGEIVDIIIANKGSGYNNLIATVRPHAVIVTVDTAVNNRWSMYQYNYTTGLFLRIHTQSYDVPLYWNYVDWSSSDFISNKTIRDVLDYTYQLPIITPAVGDYVKINNPGDNKYIILQKLDPSVYPGTFNVEYNLVYKQGGTIQFSNTIWDNNTDNYGFDTSPFDQTPFSQANEKELELILNSLINDLLNGDLQIYNNKLWFKAVKYALSEQKFLDWAFKTSFIYVMNSAGYLDQPPSYKLQDTSYYESYINETKPYHTKIRNFQSTYTATEMTSAYPTDFDLPSYYNSSTNSFSTVQLGNALMLQQPYVNWLNNFTYRVSEILVYDGGSGYTTPPSVTLVNQPGDPGYGATAEALISLGSVSKVILTNSGTNYVSAPIVQFSGGGNSSLVPARAFARITNDQIRQNLIHIKLDRVSGYDEIGPQRTLDTFVGTGSTDTFPLTWQPDTQIANFTVEINGILALPDSYSLSFSTALYNGYFKTYTNIILTTIPAEGDIVTVAYNKNINLYHSYDRIRDYYSPVAGMPGNTATLLMNGLEYPGVTIDTLPFQTSAGWDTVGWASSRWDDYDLESGYYSTFGNPNTSTFTLPFTPANGAELTIYITTTTNGILNTFRIDDPYYGTTASTNVYATTSTFIGNGLTNFVNIGTYTTSATIVDFRLTTDDGSVAPSDYDIDSIIDSGGWTPGLLSSTDSATEINIDGDGLVTPNNSYGPEENLPGTVSDTLGISVYTKPAGSSYPIVTTRRYIVDGSTSYPLGVTPPNTASVQVLFNNDLLTYGVDYTIDYNNSAIDILTNTSTSTIHYYNHGMIAPRYDTTNYIPFSYNQSADGPIQLGFTWNMFGNTFTETYLSTNGVLTFGGGTQQVTPLELGSLPYVGIYAQFSYLFVGTTLNGAGATGQPLNTGENPGYFYDTGIINGFNFIRVRFQGTHYSTAYSEPTVPAYDFEVTLYSNGVDQYVEMVYETVVPPNTAGYPGTTDLGAVYGIAGSGTPLNPGYSTGPQSVLDNTSHVYYSKASDGNFVYLGEGSFDAFSTLYEGTDLLTPTNSSSVLTLTTLGVNGTNLIDSGTVTVSNVLSNKVTFVFSTSFNNVQTAYVTVNGSKVTNYSLIEDVSGSVAVQFTTALNNNDVLQAWFFDAPYKAFNETNDQIITNISNTTTQFTLTQAPGVTPPFHDQAIITLNGTQLLPPETLYFVANLNQTTFPVTYGGQSANGDIDATQLEVYVNGQLLSLGVDYQYIQQNNIIEFNAGKVNTGDAIAVVIFLGSEYLISTDGILTLLSNVTRTGNDTLRITTYTNEDGMSMRRERFTGSIRNRYILSRQAVNTDYMWVSLNGKPLAAELEFQLDSDLQTVILNSNLKINESDSILITTIGSGSLTAQELIGFRIFYDNRGLVSYKRLSEQNSTQLVANLLSTDTEITVLDASVLTQPNLEQRIPGAILVDGERIEFYVLDLENNKLSQIKRGTLGTGIKIEHVAGTTVVDQGSNQTMRVKETIQVDTITPTTTTQISSSIVVDYGVSTSTSYSAINISTATYYTTITTASIIAYGGELIYNVYPDTYQALQPFTSDSPPLEYDSINEGNIGWLVICETSLGNVQGDNKKWFTSLQTATANSSQGPTVITLQDVGHLAFEQYNVIAVYNGSTVEYQQAAKAPLFSAPFVTDPTTGNTSTVWYVQVNPIIGTNSGNILLNDQVTLSWQQTDSNFVENIPYIITSSTVVANAYTITTETIVSTIYSTSGTVFNITGIDFTGSDFDISQQAQVYYQGSLLFNSLNTVTNHSNSIAYDSGEVNSTGQVSDPVVPNEYRITQFMGQYFLELFIPIAVNSQIRVVKETTQVWWDITSDQSLVDQNTEQIRFLRSAPAALPDKYLYGQNTDSIPVLVTEDGSTFETESGDLLLDE